MINVLPEEQKKDLRKRYFMRLVSAYIFLFGLLAFIATFLILPSYFFSNSKEKLLNVELELFDQENPNLFIDDLQKNINDINRKLNLLSNDKIQQNVIEGSVSDFLRIKREGILLYKIFYTTIDNGFRIDISGIAKDRTSLNKFKTEIESSGLYTEIDLPISNFVKPTDIEFNIKLEAK